MNIPFFIAGSLALLAAAAHFFLGTREAFLIKPERANRKVQQSWYQTLGAWHLVSWDVTFLAAALFWLAFNDHQATLASFIVIWMFGWTLAWISTLATAKAGRAYVGQLPQWILFLVIGLMTMWGAMS